MSETETQTTDTVDTSVPAATDTSAADGIQSVDQGAEGNQSTDTSTTDVTTDAVIEYTDFILPEGATVDAAMLEASTALFKEAKLDQATAQKFVDFHAGMVKAQAEAFEATKETWRKETEADPEIGGAKLKETMFMASKVMNQYGSDELKAVLDSSGLGNHPTMVKFFAKLGREISEDGAINSQSSAGVLSTEDRIGKLYANTK